MPTTVSLCRCAHGEARVVDGIVSIESLVVYSCCALFVGWTGSVW